MKTVYTARLVKKTTPESLATQEIHGTWANVINSQELYVAKGNSGDVILLFKQRKSITTFHISKDFAREHFEIIGSGAKNEEGLEISQYLNQEETYLR